MVGFRVKDVRESETQLERLKSVGVLVQQVGQIRCRIVSCRNGKEHCRGTLQVSYRRLASAIIMLRRRKACGGFTGNGAPEVLRNQLKIYATTNEILIRYHNTFWRVASGLVGIAIRAEEEMGIKKGDARSTC